MADKKMTKSSKAKLITATSSQKNLFELFSKKSHPPLSSSAENYGSSSSKPAGKHVNTTVVTTRPDRIPRSPLHPPEKEKPPRTLYSNSGASLTSVAFSPPLLDINEKVDAPRSDDALGTEVQVAILQPVTHPTFSRSLSMLSKCGSRYNPFILDSSPIKPAKQHPVVPPRETFPIFTPRRPEIPLRSEMMKSKIKMTDIPNVLSTTLGSHHVRGRQSSFSAPPPLFALRNRHVKPIDLSNPEPFYNSLKLLKDPPNISNVENSSYIASVPLDNMICPDTIPKEHKYMYPAIARLFHDIPKESSSQAAWVDKYRPIRADEVIGNEQHAIYLKNWLKALELLDHGVSQTTLDDGEGRSITEENLMGTKRPRVIRAVEKRKRRKKQRFNSEDEDDGWIANSDEAAEGELLSIDSDAEEGITYQQPRSCLYRKISDLYARPQLHTRLSHDKSGADLGGPSNVSPEKTFNGHLTNSIILAGPHSSGKTAAVYACAEELGWEVFEVYPGIGKRNGTNFDNLVGDVGKNHLVRMTQSRDPKAHPRSHTNAKFMGKGKVKSLEPEEPRPIQITNDGATASSSNNFGFVSALHTGINNARTASGFVPETTVRQSMILLEEVDILFKEDTSFWPAVTNFIRDCRRPVIFTCNDVTLIPLQDLPLQTILTFDVCPTPIATSYLQSLCYAEGFYIDRESVIQLYETTYQLNPTDYLNFPVNLRAYEFHPKPDLRRSIHTLQLWSSCFGSTQSVNMSKDKFLDSSRQSHSAGCDQQSDIKSFSGAGFTVKQDALCEKQVRHADLISFIDCDVIRAPPYTKEAFALNSYEFSPDDEIGYTILYNPAPQTSHPLHGAEFSCQDAVIAESAIQLSRGVLESGQRHPTMFAAEISESKTYTQDHVAHQSLMAGMLGSILPLSAPLIPQPAVYLDYEPWIRAIIAADDLQEFQQDKTKRSGRMTRNNQLGRYIRTIALSPEERHALTCTALQD